MLAITVEEHVERVEAAALECLSACVDRPGVIGLEPLQQRERLVVADLDAVALPVASVGSGRQLVRAKVHALSDGKRISLVARSVERAIESVLRKPERRIVRGTAGDELLEDGGLAISVWSVCTMEAESPAASEAGVRKPISSRERPTLEPMRRVAHGGGRREDRVQA